MVFSPRNFWGRLALTSSGLARFVIVLAGMMTIFMAVGGPLQVSAKSPVVKQQLPDPLADKRMLTRLASGTVRYFKYPEKIKAPINVDFYDEKGKKHSLSEWRGKTVLLNFWAPWCDACRRELPALQNLRTRLDAQKFEVVIINIEADAKKGRAYLDKLGIKNIASMLDKDNAALKKLSAIGIPTNILIDCHGRELGRLRGSAVWHADAAILLTKGLMRASGCYNDKRELL